MVICKYCKIENQGERNSVKSNGVTPAATPSPVNTICRTINAFTLWKDARVPECEQRFHARNLRKKAPISRGTRNKSPSAHLAATCCNTRGEIFNNLAPINANIYSPPAKQSQEDCATFLRTSLQKETKFLASRLTAAASFPSVVFQLLQYSRQHPSFSAHRAALMTKTDLTYPAFSLRFVDFAVQFCFRCKFSFHEKRCWSQVWQWRDFPNHNSLLRIATNEIASICIDNRLRQMAFLCLPKWAKASFRVTLKDFDEIKKLYM